MSHPATRCAAKVVAALLWAQLLSACGPRLDHPAPQTAAPDTPAAPIPPAGDTLRPWPVHRRVDISDLVMEFHVPTEVVAGRPVHLEMRFRNPSGDTVLVGMPHPSAYNFIVTRPDGQVVWARATEMLVPDVAYNQLLAPHDTLRFAHAWDQRSLHGRAVAPGMYRVQGRLGHDVVTPVRTTTIR